MGRANSNETSIELTMNELDTVAGGSSTETKVATVMCLVSPAFLIGFATAIAARTLLDAVQ
jgi:hypothetical protein